MRSDNQFDIRKISTMDYAYHELKQQILTGQLKPNTAIVEQHVAEDLSISRTPLREALQRLEIEKLLIRQPNGRLKVAPISVKEVKEIYTVREKLEEIVIIDAIDQATETDYHHLQNLMMLVRETFKQNNIDDALYYGGQFHQYIYDLSEHELAKEILSQLNDRIYRYRRLIPYELAHRFKESIEEHELVLNYMKAKDYKNAVTTIHKHMNNSLSIIIQAIKNQENV